MKDITNKNFGLLIAYVIPGIVVLRGLGEVLAPFGLKLPASQGSADGAAAMATITVGGFLNETVLALAVGMTVSTVRWVIVDTAHHYTGIRRPVWDDSKLQTNLDAFDALVENHYRYYQFCSNMFVGLFVVYAARLPQGFGINLLFIGLLTIFFAASRDALTKYYRRATLLLDSHERDANMTNGHRTDKNKQTAASEPSTDNLRIDDSSTENSQPINNPALDAETASNKQKSEQ